MQDFYELERHLVLVAIRLAEKKGLNQSEFGKAVFPEKGQPYQTLLALQKPRTPKKVTKPRALKLREAFSMAQALGLELSDLVTLAEKEARLSHQDDMAPEANGTLGA